ncbi:MAG: glycosyltransferase, partial [Candidatus Eiseniibacteriota bacterium]
MNGIGEATSMKVSHVRASNFFGGPEKQIVHHLRLLQESGSDPLLFSFQEAGRETELIVRARGLGLRCVSIPCAHAYDPRQVFRLRKLLTEEGADIVCSHDYRSNVLTRLAVRGEGISRVAFWRGVTRENLKVAFFHQMERGLLRTASHIVVVSQEQHDALISGGLSGEKVSVVPNAVSVGAVSQEIPTFFEQFSGKTVVATAGRLSPEKGHNYLIRAFSRVLEDRSDLVL